MKCRMKVERLSYFVALVVAFDRSEDKLKPIK